MKRHYSLATATIMGLATAITAVGQGNVDIGLEQNDQGQIEVRVRPQTDFEGIFSAVVFTLRWDHNSGASLGDPIQNDEVVAYMPVSRSGAVQESGPYNYQVFAGFGFQPLTAAGVSWEAGQEYTVVTIPVNGSAAVELINDNWTGEATNNADFYVSLGGADHTGEIYKGLAVSAGIEGTVNIQPNPNDGQFTFSFVVATASDVEVEVLSTLGQKVFGEVLQGFEGTYTHEMDLTSMSNGIYYLKISRSGESSVHKIVYR